MSIKLAALAGACLVLAGCSAAPVDDRPVVRIAEAARPTPAIPLGQFLPTTPELAAQLGTPPTGFAGHLVQGGPDMLLRSVGAGEASPPDCLGAAYRMQQAVYDGSPVQSVATNSWAGGTFDGPPVSAFFGIVQMGSPSAAQAFFAATSERWWRCNGVTVSRDQLGAGELSRIADVGFDDSRVVSASVLHTSSGTASPTAHRAVALAGDCIVEVEITDPRPAAGPDRSAVGVAELIANKIAAHR
ncbi:MAG: sensor domain-containing protein [Mycobacterium kyogaense]|uniref:sensor domain-containing protein n=1 Tax=Mycobacterium kyogaense TaxID=2212479 RepID=UPI002FFC2EC9